MTVTYLPDNMVGGREARRSYLMTSHRFLCQCELCSLEGEAWTRDEERRRVNLRRIGECHQHELDINLFVSAEINFMAGKIPLEVGETPLKMKYKYSCLNLLHDMEQMKMSIPSIFLIKSCIFSIYVLLMETDMAVVWARELWKMSSLMTGRESELTVNWENTVEGLETYFKDRDLLQQSVEGWSLYI